MSKKKIRNYQFGPAAIVTAAFIGPGTIITCIKSGVEDKFALLWAVVFATVSAIILQSTAARIGIITQKTLGENIHAIFKNRIMHFFSIVLVFSAILVGNSAFETGNITGVIIGLELLVPGIPRIICSIVIGLLALLLIFTLKFEKVQSFLSCCVFLMSIVFIALAIASRPDTQEVRDGIGNLSFNKVGMMNALGLVGTTIGPYGLFLHSFAATKKWSKPEDISASNLDTYISITIGGIITVAIIIAAAASLQYGKSISVSYISDLTDSLIAKWGLWTKYLLGVGLLLAGFSSCITAPIGAAVAVLGTCGKSVDFSKKSVKIIAAIVVIAGTAFSILFGNSPAQLVLFAQVINALILPLIAVFLLVCANSKLMNDHKNTPVQNIGCIFVIFVCVLICVRNIAMALNLV